MIYFSNINIVEMHFASQSKEGRAELEALVNAHPAVMQGYDDLVSALLRECDLCLLTQSQASRILDAAIYAAHRHQFQIRKDEAKTPYIIHPMGVARQIIEIGSIADPEILIGALLHDVIEDTFSPEESEKGFAEIRQLFGAAVEGYVREVTDDKALLSEERKRQQIEHAPHKSPGAAAIKFSDKLYNLGDLLHAPPPDWSPLRIKEYFKWARLVVEGLPTDSTGHLALKSAVLEVLDAR